MYKDIEFVCSGNKGRSPLAEAFAKRYLDRKNSCDLVKISSSGTLVDSLKNSSDEQLAQIISPFIPKAIERGIITQKEAFDLSQGKRVNEIRDLIFQKIKRNETEQRKVIIEEKSLSKYFDLNRKPQQTTVRPTSQYIFPLDIENYDRVVCIYEGSRFNPQIELLGEIEDPFLVTLGGYRKIVDQIEKATIEKMEKIINPPS